MGHHINGKESIVPLIDRLNMNPIGLPDSEKLREILAILFSEDEAYVASRFPLQEATMKELERATGWKEERLAPVLDDMAKKGLVMDMVYGRRTFYMLIPALIGFFEITYMKQRQDLPVKELAQLMYEYLFEDPEELMVNEFFKSPTRLTRSLTYEEHIPVHSEVTPYESAREIIKKADYGAVTMCYCRHKKEHLNKECEKDAPIEDICMSFGNGAKFLVRRGFAKEKSVDELLAILEKARDLNLTHITDNIRNEPGFICNCCSCCCGILTGVLRGFPNGVAKAGFTLEIDMESCVGCGLCVKACNVEALTRIDNPAGGKPKFKMTVDPERCLGCGACVSACKTDSLTMKRVERSETPETKKDLFKQILKEKKRLTPYVIEGVKTTVMRKIGMS